MKTKTLNSKGLVNGLCVTFVANNFNIENKGFGNIHDWLNVKWVHFEVNKIYGYISPVILYKQINNIPY